MAGFRVVAPKSQMMIQAGASEKELRQLLLSAASGIAATSVPEEHHKIIMYLLGRGVRPDFTNAEEVEEWAQGMGQISTREIQSFLLNVIDFPPASRIVCASASRNPNDRQMTYAI